MYSGHIRDRKRKDGKNSHQIVIETMPDAITGKRKRIYKTVNGTKKEAEKIMRKMLDDLDNQCFIKENNLTVSQWILDWFELYLKDLSPTTLHGYKYQIDNYIVKSPIGNIRLQNLTTNDVQKWINGLSQCSPLSNKPVSAKTIKNIYHNLSASIDKAVSLDFVKKNVCKAVSLPKVQRYTAEVYDEAEIQQLLSIIKGTDMELPLTIAVSLGLRRGELLGLKWKHIDFENGLVSIEDNMVEVQKDVSEDRILTKAPKSVSGQRTIPISSALKDYLSKAHSDYVMRKQNMKDLFYDGDYVVCQENGRPYKPNSFSGKFNLFLKRNNLKHIRLHDIRHTNATLMLTQGISPKVAQMRLGHSDYSTTMNIYSHVLKSVETEAAEAIENALFKNL